MNSCLCKDTVIFVWSKTKASWIAQLLIYIYFVINFIFVLSVSISELKVLFVFQFLSLIIQQCCHLCVQTAGLCAVSVFVVEISKYFIFIKAAFTHKLLLLLSQGNRYEQEKLLKQSNTLYVGNLSFYTTEEQVRAFV